MTQVGAGQNVCSYAGNIYIIDKTYWGNPPQQQNKVKNASRTMILMEARCSANGRICWLTPQYFEFRHKGINNVLFCDGHVQGLKQNQIPHNNNTLPGYFSGMNTCTFWQNATPSCEFPNY